MAKKEAFTNGEIQSLTKPDEVSRRKRRGIGSRTARAFRKNILVLATLVAIVGGLCLGVGLRTVHLSEDALLFLGLPGELFLRCLKCTIVPLVVCMVITSTSTLEPKRNGKIAIVATFGFVFTHVIASIIAVVLFYVFKPGTHYIIIVEEDFDFRVQTQDVFMDLLRNIFPDNLVGATLTQTTTTYTRPLGRQDLIDSPSNETANMTTLRRSIGQSSGMNIIGLITICSALGIAANKILVGNREFLRFFQQAQAVLFVIVGWLFWTTPVGVASLISQSVASVKDLEAVFYDLGMLVVTVIVGLAIHLLVALSLIFFLLVRQNPFTFIIRCMRPFFIAFASTATAVAMPEMLTSSQRCGIDPGISSFVIPMSVNLHADGSALYITSGALFLAQTSGRGIGVGDVFVVGTLSSVLALAIPPVPSSSIVTLVIILTSLNVPLHGVAMLFAVEWLLDRCRSGVNAVSHVMVAAYTQAICGKSDVTRRRGRGVAARVESLIVSEDGDACEIADNSLTQNMKNGRVVSENICDGDSSRV